MSRQPHGTLKARENFIINLAALAPFIAVIATGLVLQVYYHLHHLPGGAPVLGLTGHGWGTLHRISAVFSLIAAGVHCTRHRGFIVTATRKHLYRKKISSAVVSYYLFILLIPTALTALASWIFLKGHARFMLVELHDKLALLLTAVFLAHLATRAGWMMKTYRSLASRGEGGILRP